MKRTAVLIDGGFFSQRIFFFARKYFRKELNLSAEQMMAIIRRLVKLHVEDVRTAKRELYRIYYYDCPPPQNQIRFPLPEAGNVTPGHFNQKAHPPYMERLRLHDQLRKNRKTALRLGELTPNGEWQLNSHALKDLLAKRRTWEELTNRDFHYKVEQKTVDTKLGMDITTLSLERLADVIVLVAGDSDFVPASKLARMKGIDFVLDPMWANVTASLSEHVDGVRSFDLVRIIRDVTGEAVTNQPVWWQQPAVNTQPNFGAAEVIAISGDTESDPGLPETPDA